MASLVYNSRLYLPSREDNAAGVGPRLGSRSHHINSRLEGLRLRSKRAECLIPSVGTARHSDLATYRLPHHSSVGHSSAAPWFHAAVTEVVKHLESAPFLQLVRFADGKINSEDPKFSSFSVPESVVGAPELWSSIAQAVTAETADVVILVQRVDPHSNDATPSEPQQPIQALEQPSAGAASSSSASASTSMHRLSSSELKAHVEDACRKLEASGVGESILHGKVGECCDRNDRSGVNTSSSSALGASSSQPGILPFAIRATPARTAVKVKALPTSGVASPAPLSGYWGVVVQSRHHTGAEGCYLLRAVRQICPPTGSDADHGHGCSCTHYSLTKVCRGENVARQFVNSWLV